MRKAIVLLFFWALAELCWSSGTALAAPTIAHSVRTSLSFEEVPGDPYLHIVLHLINTSNSDLYWTMDPQAGIDADLISSSGLPASSPNGPVAMDYFSKQVSYHLPVGGKVDILLSHTGIGLNEEAGNRYVIELGDKIWYLRRERASGYTLRVKLYAGAYEVFHKIDGDFPIISPQKIYIIH